MSPDTLVLFDENGTPTHRTNDPDTSRDYGRGDPSRNALCAKTLLVLASLGAHGGCVSDITAGIRTRWGRSSERSVISRRITDLALGFAAGVVTAAVIFALTDDDFPTEEQP